MTEAYKTILTKLSTREDMMVLVEYLMYAYKEGYVPKEDFLKLGNYAKDLQTVDEKTPHFHILMIRIKEMVYLADWEADDEFKFVKWYRSRVINMV